MMAETKGRLTAKKVRVIDVVKGMYTPADGMKPGYILTGYGMKISRVRIMATIVNKFMSEDKNFASVTLDDGTETIRAKSFGSTKFFDNVNVGDSADTIGKIREYNDEIYIIPEIVTKITDPNLESLRRLELLKQYTEWKKKLEFVKSAKEKYDSPEKIFEALKGDVNTEDAETILELLQMPVANEPQKEEDENAKKTVLQIITEFDKGEGVAYGDLIEKSKFDEKSFDKAINELLEEGTCYEPKPGQLRKC